MADCLYCDKGEKMLAVGLEIAPLSVSTLYLFREQSHKGRCIVAYNRHVSDLTELNDEQRNAFFADVATASRTIQALYHPDKVNYGAYSDTLPHLHFHLVPKYKDDGEWGTVFAMNPKRKMLEESGYTSMVEEFRQQLSK